MVWGLKGGLKVQTLRMRPGSSQRREDKHNQEHALKVRRDGKIEAPVPLTPKSPLARHFCRVLERETECFPSSACLRVCVSVCFLLCVCGSVYVRKAHTCNRLAFCAHELHFRVRTSFKTSAPMQYFSNRNALKLHVFFLEIYPDQWFGQAGRAEIQLIKIEL